jgi:hypothetical protein
MLPTCSRGDGSRCWSGELREKRWFRHRQYLKTKREKCEGWDSNPRTPTRLGPQPSAFDLAWLPSPLCHNKEVVYLIKTCVSAPLPARGRDRIAADIIAGDPGISPVEPGDPAWLDYAVTMKRRAPDIYEKNLPWKNHCELLTLQGLRPAAGAHRSQ